MPLIPNVFHLTLIQNPGVAFGLFREHGGLLFALITLSVLGLLWWTHTFRPDHGLGEFALAFVLGGAVGNWIDRVRWGAVIDFLDFRVWPVFNLADSAITVGVGLYLFSFLLKGRGTSSKA